ncbi:MAG TPA: hemolysin family protein [Terriglobales bacterium]|nr:hemolysin family protein [Terriglobales bacterium]
MITYVLLRVFLVLLLVALNAFFVAAEFALVSVRDTRIQQLIEQRRIGARTVQKLHHNLDEVLNAVQLGITIASLALGWIGEATMAAVIEPLFHNVPYAAVYAHAIAIGVAFTLITYLHVILGEVVPKSLALQRAERIALAISGPMDVIMTIFRPFLAIMNSSSRVVLRLFGTRQVREGGVHSPDELKLIVTASRRVGLLPPLQEEMLHRALELGDVTVREIMTPRPDIFSLPADMAVEEAMTRVVEKQRSRVPVYDPKLGPEYIVGVLYAKDLARLLHQKLVKFRGGVVPDSPSVQAPIRQVMRDVLVVPDTKPVADLLTEFQSRKRHLAVVVDEFGSTAGVVTVEDALEAVVGEIEDEYDVAEQPPLPLGSTTLILDGGENIRDLEARYRLVLPRDQGFETLAGFVLARLGRIPTPGDGFDFDGHRYTVLQMENRRVSRVKVESSRPAPIERAGD